MSVTLTSGNARGLRARAFLAGALVLSGFLLCVVWALLRRPPSFERTALAPARSLPAARVSRELASGSPPSTAGATRVGIVPAPAPRSQTDAASPSTLVGFLTVDGLPPEDGWVVLRAADGTWERTDVPVYQGSFRAEGVPSATVTLSFELPPRDERRLLLPTLTLAPGPGRGEPLDLHWETTQVNVRVRDDGGGSAASLSIEGPQCVASLDTNEKGKAFLSVVGTGRFQLSAFESGGRRGGAALDLEGGEGLETVVITLADALSASGATR